MGRGGNFLLTDIPYAFRIRVVAPLDMRIDRIMEREQVDNDTARWLIDKTDRKDRASCSCSMAGLGMMLQDTTGYLTQGLKLWMS